MRLSLGFCYSCSASGSNIIVSDVDASSIGSRTHGSSNILGIGVFAAVHSCCRYSSWVVSIIVREIGTICGNYCECPVQCVSSVRSIVLDKAKKSCSVDCIVSLMMIGVMNIHYST